jgi:hypothetical protein
LTQKLDLATGRHTMKRNGRDRYKVRLPFIINFVHKSQTFSPRWRPPWKAFVTQETARG